VSAAALIILLLTSLFDFAGGSQWSILLASKCTRLTAYGRLALSFINLGLSWYFVRYTSLGVIGVLVPTLMIEMFWRPIMLWYTCKIIGLPVREYLRKAYLGPLMASVVVMTFVVSLRLVVGCETLGGLLAVIILAGLAVPIIAWTIGLDRSERAAFRKLA
jgi:O-antigen/teichoic acid export membrane protein